MQQENKNKRKTEERKLENRTHSEIGETKDRENLKSRKLQKIVKQKTNEINKPPMLKKQTKAKKMGNTNKKTIPQRLE